MLAIGAANHHLMDLACTIDKPSLTGIAINPFQNSVLAVAACAAQLNCRISRQMQGIGYLNFRHRDLWPGFFTLLKPPRCTHGQKPAGINGHRNPAKLHLYTLAIGKLNPKSLTLTDITACDFHTTLGKTQPAHAVGQPR